MKWTIEFIEAGKYFRVISSGIHEIGEAEPLYNDLFSHPLWTPGSAVLRDLRSLDFRHASYDLVSSGVKVLMDYQHLFGNARIAYLVDSDVGFGVCRQVQVMMESDSALRTNVFRDESAAIEWLTGGTGAEEK